MRKICIYMSCWLILICGQMAVAQNYLNQPEGIAFDSLHNRWLVSNWANGAIVQIDSNGVQSAFKTGLGNCAGMHIVGNTLYVASNNSRIVGLDLTTAVTIMVRDFAAAGGCHDITSDSSGFLYATDWGRGRIYKVNPVTNTYTVFVSAGLDQPLGIHFDAFNNRLLVCSMTDNFPIKAVDLIDSTVSVVRYTDWPQDGITEDELGNYYITSLTDGFDLHSVYRFDSAFSYPPEVITTGYYGLTDACYNARDNILAVTSYWDNTITFIPIYGSVQLRGEDFSDAAYGDGDGVLEGGETVELVITVTNNGPRPVENLWLSLSVDDASLNILAGAESFGDIPPGGMINNSSHPFKFEIPPDYMPRLGSFSLEAFWEGDFGEEIDTLTFEKGIGQVSILLVDDDDGDNLENYYISCFRDSYLPYDYFETGDGVCPDTAIVNSYDMVIWFTGDFRTTPLSADEIGSMEYFMDNGGKLFLTGQRIAAQLDGDDPVFLGNYLKSQYLSTSIVPLLAAHAGGAVFDISDSVSLQGSGSAANQLAPDHLAAINGGVGELTYLGGADLGAVSYAGSYSLVFFGFGFEAIGDPRWRSQNEIMLRILDFFECRVPPLPLELEISSGDAWHLVDHTPVISWAYLSAEKNAQVMYRIQVGIDNDWESAEMWDTQPVTGAETEAIYSGNALEDGQAYYLRLQISDGLIWSNWYYGQFRMNSLPSVPTGLSPDNMENILETPPILSHNNSTDNEGDDLSYSYEVYDDSLMSSPVAQASDLSENPGGQTSWTIDAILPGNEDYFWRVRAGDGYENGPWSPLASFYFFSFICGDANGDDQVNVGDAVFLINHVFKGGPGPDPVCSGDANGDGNTNVGDAVYLINHVFKSGPPPVEDCCK